MGKIDRSESNIYQIPPSVSVTPRGYVLMNMSATWVKGKDGKRGHCDHKKVIVGQTVVEPGGDWKSDRRMYANATYLTILNNSKNQNNYSENEGDNKDLSCNIYESYSSSTQETQTVEKLPPNQKKDGVNIGAFVVVAKACKDIGLIEILEKVFGYHNAMILLDLALYMLLEESATFQHFPIWARSNAIFSPTITDDTSISRFEKYGVSVSQINHFKTLWARHVLLQSELPEDICLCYDSTNVNSRAEGVSLVEYGHAKDDKTLPQVNSDYIVRESDGLTVSFTLFPGSITDISEAPSMISFFRDLLYGLDQSDLNFSDQHLLDSIIHHLTIICDRGYISEANVRSFDEAHINFLLLLRRDLNVSDDLVTQYGKAVKSSQNYVQATKQHAMTVQGHLFDGDKKTRYFHIVWDPKLYTAHKEDLMDTVHRIEVELEKKVNQKIPVTKDDLYRYYNYFSLKAEAHDSYVKQCSVRKKKVETYLIKEYERNYTLIDTALDKCGFYILVSSNEITIEQALKAYSSRDCVEKVFRALKSFLGMDKYGVHGESSMHTKSLIWMLSSVMRSMIMKIAKKAKGTKKDSKNYTVPATIRVLQDITADRNLITGKYNIRYTLTALQKSLVNAACVTEEMIDKYAGTMTANPK